MLPENINRLAFLKEIFGLQLSSRHSNHQVGEVLDLIFDSKVSKSVSWAPYPYSNLFINFLQPQKFHKNMHEIKN